MKHTIEISTAEALLINKALGFDMQNDTDNKMAERLKDKINNIIVDNLSKQPTCHQMSTNKVDCIYYFSCKECPHYY